jgi:hypothetical protein
LQEVNEEREAKRVVVSVWRGAAGIGEETTGKVWWFSRLLHREERKKRGESNWRREGRKRGKLGFPGEEFKGGDREQVGEEGPQRGG